MLSFAVGRTRLQFYCVVTRFIRLCTQALTSTTALCFCPIVLSSDSLCALTCLVIDSQSSLFRSVASLDAKFNFRSSLWIMIVQFIIQIIWNWASHSISTHTKSPVRAVIFTIKARFLLVAIGCVFLPQLCEILFDKVRYIKIKFSIKINILHF